MITLSTQIIKNEIQNTKKWKLEWYLSNQNDNFQYSNKKKTKFKIQKQKNKQKNNKWIKMICWLPDEKSRADERGLQKHWHWLKNSFNRVQIKTHQLSKWWLWSKSIFIENTFKRVCQVKDTSTCCNTQPWLSLKRIFKTIENNKIN